MDIPDAFGINLLIDRLHTKPNSSRIKPSVISGQTQDSHIPPSGAVGVRVALRLQERLSERLRR